MLVCSVQRIFRSILVGKFILPRLQKYFRGTPFTYFESIWSAILSSLSSRLSSILMFTPVFVWLLPSSLLWIINGILLYKINFCVIFRKFLGKHLSMESEYLYTSFGVVVCTILRYVNLPYPGSKKIIYWVNICIQVMCSICQFSKPYWKAHVETFQVCVVVIVQNLIFPNQSILYPQVSQCSWFFLSSPETQHPVLREYSVQCLQCKCLSISLLIFFTFKFALSKSEAVLSTAGDFPTLWNCVTELPSFT